MHLITKVNMIFQDVKKAYRVAALKYHPGTYATHNFLCKYSLHNSNR